MLFGNSLDRKFTTNATAGGKSHTHCVTKILPLFDDYTGKLTSLVDWKQSPMLQIFDKLLIACNR